jgi:hypothetical protein
MPVGKLNSLQLRPISPNKVAKIIKEFDPDAVGTLYISQRADGSYWVLDGNNRREAVHRLWGPEAQVPTQIYSGLTVEQEKLLFVKFNENRTKPKPLDIFVAKLGGGDEVAQGIAKIVVGKHGLEFSVQPGIARLAAVQAITVIYESGSPDVLDRTLQVVSDAWGKHTDSYHTQVLLGVGVLLARYPELDTARLTKVLADTSPKRLVSLGQAAKASELDSRGTDHRSGSYIARLILGLYNKRLRQDSVVAWVDQPGRYYWTETAEYSRIALQKLAEGME